MKILFKIAFALIIIGTSFSQNQNEIRGSMGIDFVSIPSLKDYLDKLPYEELNDLNSAINFSGSYGRMISETFQLQAEFSYLLYSFTSSDITGQYDLTYSILMPSLISYYVLTGAGYNFKFGGGVGVRFLTAEESLPGTGSKDKYNSTGYGFILRAEGNTAISQNVFAHIGADARYDFIGKPDETAGINSIGNVDFSSLSFGVRLGISYQF